MVYILRLTALSYRGNTRLNLERILQFLKGSKAIVGDSYFHELMHMKQ
jgi:hypothetical protein